MKHGSVEWEVWLMIALVKSVFPWPPLHVREVIGYAGTLSFQA
jgi:hypothetical protein